MLSNLNSNFALTGGYLNPALNNPAPVDSAIQRFNNWSQVYIFFLTRPRT